MIRLISRPWTGRSVEAPLAAPVLARGSDGAWVVARLADGALELYAIAPDGLVQDARLAVRPQTEVGVGWLRTGPELDLGLIEEEDGVFAIRLYRVRDDLTMSDRRTVAGGKRGTLLMSLPACGQQVPAGVMATERASLALRLPEATLDAVLSQTIRFDATRACVERATASARSSKASERDTTVVTLGNVDGPAVIGGLKRELTGVSCRLEW